MSELTETILQTYLNARETMLDKWQNPHDELARKRIEKMMVVPEGVEPRAWDQIAVVSLIEAFAATLQTQAVYLQNAYISGIPSPSGSLVGNTSEELALLYPTTAESTDGSNVQHDQ